MTITLLHSGYAALLAIWEDRVPITIKTSSGIFKNMAITSLTGTRAIFQQIHVVRGEAP